MVMIYRIRVILDNDTNEDIFRDIEIRNTDTLEDLHNTITQSFGFDGSEMASFYLSDVDWNQGEEYSLFDMSDTGSAKLMSDTGLETVLTEEQSHLIYVYDFLSMWTFYVELMEIVDEAPSTDYPNLVFAHGQIPTDAPEKNFAAEADAFDSLKEYDDDYDVDDYESMDFDENWN